MNKQNSAAADYRSNIYYFLSLVYLREPRVEFMELLEAGDFRSNLEGLGVIIDAVPRKAFKLEYTRLFLGPGEHIPPYESVFTDPNAYASGYGQIYGDAARQVEKWYQKYGFEISDEFGSIPDQVGVELSFMHMLTAIEDPGPNVLADQAEFIKNHLANWVPTFCDQAAQIAELDFYKTILALTKEFVLSEHRLSTQASAGMPALL